MRKYTENNMAGQKASRKCISRAQMAEPYELSQDLLDKQMEVLSNKYGGQNQANSAANTIQRAYRRYTMDKKFKAITSAANVKTENRLSRRFANLVGNAPPGPEQESPTPTVSTATTSGMDYADGSGGQSNFHHECCVYSSSGKSSYAGRCLQQYICNG